MLMRNSFSAGNVPYYTEGAGSVQRPLAGISGSTPAFRVHNLPGKNSYAGGAVVVPICNRPAMARWSTTALRWVTR